MSTVLQGPHPAARGWRSRWRDRRPTIGRRALLVAAAVALASGCTDDDRSDDEPAATVSHPFEGLPELIQDVAPSTVSIQFSAAQAGQVFAGGGSGVIWDADGIIVTNDHVVAPADDIEVMLADGSRYDAEVLAGDARTDIAVLRIDASDLPAATFSERLPDIGEFAVALGNPLGLQNTATAGIVSGVDRSLPVTPDAPPLVGLIQTDAAISSGNSGGALLDSSGDVIGINVAAVDDAQIPGVAQGLGFAIPSSTVVAVVEQLIEDGEVAHAHLGIRGTNLTPQLAERFGIDRDDGVLIGEVMPDGPAEAAGLEQGQVIIELDGRDVGDLGDLFAALQRAAPGDTVPVVVANGEEQTVEVVLSDPPDDEPVR